MIACSRCAADNPEGSRFCNQCGTRLDGAATPPVERAGYTPRHLVERVLRDRSAMIGERKRVTVLFADIKGSTRLAEQAGAEAWHGILDRFFGLLALAVHRYEGTINQYTGDGVMALFGAPVAHEDHAQRACHAALEMQATVREFADVLRLEHGLNLTLRVGLNTGEVVVGRIGDDLRMDYTAQGATVNLAARMEQICEPGQIYLSRATAVQVDGAFALRSLGATRVSGLDRAVEVFALEGRARQESRLARRLAGGASPFFGRAQELARLQACLAQAASAGGRVVAVTGAAGIGKSRLFHEFLAAVAERGVRVHRAAASPYAPHEPMAAPRALYLSRIGCEVGGDTQRIRDCIQADLPEALRSRPGALAFAMEFAGVGRPGELNETLAASLRDSMMQLLAQYLPRADQPQVLLFEDLQHLDDLTLDFVRQLAAGVAGTSTLLLLSWRGDAAPDPVPPVHETLELGALDAQALQRLANAALGTDASVRELGARIAARSGGNPFYVEEAVTALAETGALAGAAGAWRLPRPVDQLPIPDSVHALIAARIDRLAEPDKAWLQAASVIGEVFDPTLLIAVNPRGGDPLASLDALEQAGFLQRAGGVRRFAQPLLREVAYGAQLESSRMRRHARLAAALERRCENDPVQAAARGIAEHWALAGDWERAGQWNLHAARWFATRDPRITAAQYQRALVHLDRAAFSPQVRRLRIAARAGLIRQAQFTQLDEASVNRAYAEARALADECGDPLCAAELSISYGAEQLQRGRAGLAAQLVEAGVRECPAQARATVAARFRLPILLSFGSIGRLREGIEFANWASGGDAWLSGPIDADNTLSRAFVSIQHAWAGELERGRSDLDLAIGIAERDGRMASWMHGLRVEMAWFSGNLDGVLEQADRAVEQAEAMATDYFRALALRGRGQALILLGRHREAIRTLRESLPMTSPGAGGFQFRAHHRAVLAEALLGTGQVDEAAQEAQAAVASAQASGARLWELRAWIAQLALPVGALDAEAARAGFERAGELVRTMAARGVEPRLDECAALRLEGRAERARALENVEQGYARIGAVGHARRIRAMLYA